MFTKTVINRIKRVATALLAASVLATLSSCGVMDWSGNDLYKLPRVAGYVTQLQREIDEVIAEGGEYAAPVSGTYRQSIQLEDLNGDGSDEAIVFLRMPEGMLRVCLFIKDSQEIYSLYDDAVKEGTSFDTVSYFDLNGDGTRELLVGRSAGSGLPKSLSVLSPDEDGFREMLSAQYSGYSVIDIDGDGSLELVIARHDISELAETSGTVEVYRYSTGDRAMLQDDVATLSGGLTSLKRLRTGKLLGGEPAVFVSGEPELGSISTDIFAFRDGKLTNITLDTETGLTREIVTGYTIWGGDLNGDGVFDLPMPVVLPSYETRVSGDTFRKVIWRNYDIMGEVHSSFETFHNNSDGWYFIIPDHWSNMLTADRRDNVGGTSGERAIVLSHINTSGEVIDLLTIYSLTGDNRRDRSELPGRFVITTPQTRGVTTTIYAAKISTLTATMSAYAITPEQVTSAFKLIQTEWLSGELIN